MATEKQIAANRANAQKCTGPTSEKGRATSSMNALKTGLDAKSEIIEECEDRGERDALTAAWYARFRPATEQECYLLDTAISSEWMQRRYLSVEANLWKESLDSSPSLGRAFDSASQKFTHVDRRLNSAHRNHSSAMKQLHALRAQRGVNPMGDIVQAKIGAEIPANDVATEPLNPELVSFRTFPVPDPPAEVQPDPAPSDII